MQVVLVSNTDKHLPLHATIKIIQHIWSIDPKCGGIPQTFVASFLKCCNTCQQKLVF